MRIYANIMRTISCCGLFSLVEFRFILAIFDESFSIKWHE